MVVTSDSLRISPRQALTHRKSWSHDYCFVTLAGVRMEGRSCAVEEDRSPELAGGRYLVYIHLRCFDCFALILEKRKG